MHKNWNEIRMVVSCLKKSNISLWDDIDTKSFDRYHQLRMVTYESIKNKKKINFGGNYWGSNVSTATEWTRYHTKDVLPNSSTTV